jgi:hypothetical protein
VARRRIFDAPAYPDLSLKQICQRLWVERGHDNLIRSVLVRHREGEISTAEALATIQEHRPEHWRS